MILSVRIALTLYFSSPASAPAYFGNDYTRACADMKSYDAAFEQSAKKFGLQPEFLKAIVFPEFLRYSYLSDFMESLALEQLYTEYGSGMADFSIGHCQMKPSFAEDIENRCKKHTELKSELKGINILSNSASRSERVERLKSIKWQTQYVAWFVKLAIEKFELEELSDEKKLIALATIYNRGMNTRIQDIDFYTRNRLFPNGNRVGANNPYAYGEVSLYYFKKIASDQ